MNWLFKEEPTHYSYDDLVRDGKTSWTGVKNPVAATICATASMSLLRTSSRNRKSGAPREPIAH